MFLQWPEEFKAKNHSIDHTPASPSIRKTLHFVRSKKELDNCTVINWDAYLRMRLERAMRVLLRLLILESQRMNNLSTEGDARPHQL